MIILEGKNGKSVVLEEMVNNRLMNASVVILDTVGVRHMRTPENVVHWLIGGSIEDVMVSYEMGAFKDYEWVIFEFNVPVEEFDIERFKELDRKTTQNLLVTVQTDGDIKMKFA